MAGPYTIAADEVGAYEKLLLAATAETFTFASHATRIRIETDGAARIYYRTDGTAPVVAGANARVIPAVAGVEEITMPAGQNAVKMISVGAPTVSVSQV